MAIRENSIVAGALHWNAQVSINFEVLNLKKKTKKINSMRVFAVNEKEKEKLKA